MIVHTLLKFKDRSLSGLPLVLIAVIWSVVLMPGSISAQDAARTATANDASEETQSPSGATVLHTGTRLVVVDVEVEDANGHPVHGLNAQDFHLAENDKPQAIHNFEEHTASSSVERGPELPQMPPGTFIDYNPVPPTGTLNILLLDALNTPTKDQGFVREQLLEYVKHADPRMRIAIFGLTDRLLVLQGFTSDPAILKDVVEHKLTSRSSNLLEDPDGSGTDPVTLSETAATLAPQLSDSSAGAQSIVSTLQQFEAGQQAFQFQLRVQYTLDAFNELAHYLSNFQGRKNVIWFSGSFPINIQPDPNLDNSFAIMETNNAAFREMTNLLARSQVAVYPVDARGLMVAPTYDAAGSGHKYASNATAFGKDITAFNSSQATEHQTMDQMAEDTGGRAFYNTNGLAEAVDKAIAAGSNYYTLTYSPSDRRQDGAYRRIKIGLSGPAATNKLQLSYRQGYYADEPEKTSEAATASTATGAEMINSTDAYIRSAMSRGAPAPNDILFKVSILPTSDAIENTIGGKAAVQLAGPIRRYKVKYVALSRDFTLTLQSDGRHTGAIEFKTFIFAPDGTLLNAIEKTVRLELNSESYRRFMDNNVDFDLEVSAPAKGESYLRIGIEDIPSNRIGVVEVPVSTVSHLAPAIEEPSLSPH